MAGFTKNVLRTGPLLRPSPLEPWLKTEAPPRFTLPAKLLILLNTTFFHGGSIVAAPKYRTLMNPLRALTLLAIAALGINHAHAGNRYVRINEVMAGLNADSGVQYVELAVRDEGQKQWGPRGAETAGRCALVFTNSAGMQTGRFVFPSDPAFGASTVLVATAEFAKFTGITPDFIMPRLVMPLAGKVSFVNNPANASAEAIDVSLAYGGVAFTGSTGISGPANVSTLAIMGSQSLRRVAHFDASSFGTGTQFNTDFALGTPTPAGTTASGGATPLAENTAGQVVLPGAASQIKQGENLFVRETFLGNGRTCASCHVPSERFSLSPARIAALPADDPLFVMDANINTLVVSGTTQPSDFALGGVIKGTLGGSAKVLAGSGTTYQIIGGASLNIVGNVIADAAGNRGTFVSFTAGNLTGPTPTNTDNFGLERNAFLKSARALFVENINGTDRNSFLRASPSVMNVKFTAPYGLSGDIADLQTFASGAIAQHAPRSLNRVAGTDFRTATTAELDAMAAYQNSLTLPASENFDEANNYDRFLTTALQRQGRDLFLGPVAKCSACHGGKTLSTSSGAPGTIAGLNQVFNTGVSAQPVNAGPNGLPTEQAIGQPANSRTFSVPPLMGIGKIAPYFHESSAANLNAAVVFYDSASFNNSPAHAPGSVGNIGPIVTDQAAAFVAFLSVVGEEPNQPVLAGVVGNQTQTTAASLKPFSAVTVTDATVPAQTLTVTVALDDAAKGTLSTLGGFTLTAPGVWTFSGTATAATTALRGLVFDHAPNRTPLGLTETTRFTIGVNDGVATTLFNDTTTIISTTVATPAITPIASQSAVNAGASNPVTFSLAGLNTAAADFTLTATSSNGGLIAPGSIQLGGTGMTRTLTVTPEAGASGTSTITVTATQAGQTVTQTFQVTVVPFVASLAAGATSKSITFSAQPGQTYIIEKKSDLSAANWDTVQTIVATQASITADLPTESGDQMFYRVRTAP
jgi:cytochrome c peroxidase